MNHLIHDVMLEARMYRQDGDTLRQSVDRAFEKSPRLAKDTHPRYHRDDVQRVLAYYCDERDGETIESVARLMEMC